MSNKDNSINIEDVLKAMNNHWRDNIKLINNKEVVIGRINYKSVILTGMFLSFRDNKDEITGVIRRTTIDRYDEKDNSLIFK